MLVIKVFALLRRTKKWAVAARAEKETRRPNIFPVLWYETVK